MPPKFLYFDLGNVLLTFSNERACSQMAAIAGAEVSRVKSLVLGPHEQSSFLWKFERGDIGEDEFYETFCQQLGVAPDRCELQIAASDMFAPIQQSFQLIEKLAGAGHRLGVLSNTNPWHWQFVSDGRYPILRDLFEHQVTSFAANSMKPEREIYDFAVKRAGVPAESVFFVDDRKENVEGAREAGLDAVIYVGHEQLLADLAERQILLG